MDIANDWVFFLPSKMSSSSIFRFSMTLYIKGIGKPYFCLNKEVQYPPQLQVYMA